MCSGGKSLPAPLFPVFRLHFSFFWCIMCFRYPGVAQLVGRLVWDQDAASSSLATRTKSPESANAESGLFCLYGARLEQLNATRTSVAAASSMAANLYLRLKAQMQTSLATRTKTASFQYENWRFCNRLWIVFEVIFTIFLRRKCFHGIGNRVTPFFFVGTQKADGIHHRASWRDAVRLGSHRANRNQAVKCRHGTIH